MILRVRKKTSKIVTIMPAGDSLAQGVGDTTTTAVGGYRMMLLSSMTSRLGFQPRFVGDNNTNSSAWGFCGVSGLRVDELYEAPYIYTQVPQFRPDVIPLHIGTNDCTQLHNLTPGYKTLAESRASYTTLLDYIRTTSPNTIVLACLIIDNNTAHSEVVAYNTAINTDIQARSDYASGKVKIVDMYTGVGLYSATNYADGSHLNYAGYTLMAATYQTALNTIF